MRFRQEICIERKAVNVICQYQKSYTTNGFPYDAHSPVPFAVYHLRFFWTFFVLLNSFFVVVILCILYLVVAVGFESLRLSRRYRNARKSEPVRFGCVCNDFSDFFRVYFSLFFLFFFFCARVGGCKVNVGRHLVVLLLLIIIVIIIICSIWRRVNNNNNSRN